MKFPEEAIYRNRKWLSSCLELVEWGKMGNSAEEYKVSFWGEK
jgi:hypothetical protein